jgi:hypothetical protein
LAPQSQAATGDKPDTRLSTVIAKARMSPESESYLDELDRARADRVFSDIASAIERGQRILDPRSADARLLQRLLDDLRAAEPSP